MSKAYLSLGSNIGDRRAYLRAAIKILSANSSIDITKVSSVYETESVGRIAQRPFLNIVAELETGFSCVELLKVCQFVEDFLKRKRQEKWGARNIDVDIVLFGEEEIRESGLTVPHPELTKRAFILVPLLEIAPAATLPDGESLSKRLDEISDQSVVKVGELDE